MVSQGMVGFVLKDGSVTDDQCEAVEDDGHQYAAEEDEGSEEDSVRSEESENTHQNRCDQIYLGQSQNRAGVGLGEGAVLGADGGHDQVGDEHGDDRQSEDGDYREVCGSDLQGCVALETDADTVLEERCHPVGEE